MLYANDKNLETRFLKQLCKIKNWSYQANIEIYKDREIREFVSIYLFHNKFNRRISFTRLNFLFERARLKMN